MHVFSIPKYLWQCIRFCSISILHRMAYWPNTNNGMCCNSQQQANINKKFNKQKIHTKMLLNVHSWCNVTVCQLPHPFCPDFSTFLACYCGMASFLSLTTNLKSSFPQLVEQSLFQFLFPLLIPEHLSLKCSKINQTKRDKEKRVPLTYQVSLEVNHLFLS